MTPTDRLRPQAAPTLSGGHGASGSRTALARDAALAQVAVPTDDRTASSRVGEREAFVREPAPRRTQPAASVTSDDFAAENYAESTSYTERGHRPLSGAGYRRSRHQAERLKRDLRYGQYLEVPKGQRTIFASQRRGMGPAVAVLIAAVIIVVVVALVFAFWPR